MWNIILDSLANFNEVKRWRVRAHGFGSDRDADAVHQLLQSEMFVISVLINAEYYRETDLIEVFAANSE